MKIQITFNNGEINTLNLIDIMINKCVQDWGKTPNIFWIVHRLRKVDSFTLTNASTCVSRPSTTMEPQQLYNFQLAAVPITPSYEETSNSLNVQDFDDQLHFAAFRDFRTEHESQREACNIINVSAGLETTEESVIETFTAYYANSELISS